MNFLFLWFGVISLIFGAIGGLLQKNWILIFVYSMIVNVGNLLMIYSFGDLFSLSLGIYFQLFYFLASLFFLFFLRGMGKNVEDSKNIYKMNPWLSILYSILFFSFMGIPPFFGFFVKLPLISLIFSKGSITLVLLFLFSNLLNIVLYLRATFFLIYGSYVNPYWSHLQIRGEENGKVISVSFYFFVFFLFFFPILLVVIEELL